MARSVSRYAASTVSVHRRTGSFAGLVLPTWGWYSRPSHQCDVAAPWEGGLAALGRKAECGGETSRGSKTAATALSFPILAIQLPPTFPGATPLWDRGGPLRGPRLGEGCPSVEWPPRPADNTRSGLAHSPNPGVAGSRGGNQSH